MDTWQRVHHFHISYFLDRTTMHSAITHWRCHTYNHPVKIPAVAVNVSKQASLVGQHHSRMRARSTTSVSGTILKLWTVPR